MINIILNLFILFSLIFSGFCCESSAIKKGFRKSVQVESFLFLDENEEPFEPGNYLVYGLVFAHSHKELSFQVFSDKKKESFLSFILLSFSDALFIQKTAPPFYLNKKLV